MSPPWGEPPTVDAPTLATLGAKDLSTEQLAALAAYLRTLASWLDELRFLELERRHRLLQGIPNRPTIGHYLRTAATGGQRRPTR